jgi:hypothetical protein
LTEVHVPPVPAEHVALHDWLYVPLIARLVAAIGLVNANAMDEFTVTFQAGVALTLEGVLLEVALHLIL